MKKVIPLFFAIMASFILSSCDKETVNETLNIGYIQCTNVSSDPYFVNISGPTNTAITLQGNRVQTVAVKSGYYNIEVAQQSGYILYPTKQSFSGNVQAGKTIYVVFPK